MAPDYFLGHSVPGFQNKKQQFSWVLSPSMVSFYSFKMVLSGRIRWEGRTLNYIMCVCVCVSAELLGCGVRSVIEVQTHVNDITTPVPHFM